MNLPSVTIPEGSFISEYLELMKPQETPAIYDFMCALWCLSIACGRNTYVARPKAPVRLNIYIVLSSDSGVTRKSTSVRVATNITRDFLRIVNSTLLLIESKVTAGLLEHQLYEATKKHGHSHVAISASELAAVLSRTGGLSTLPALLTDLYDCADARSGGGTLMMGTGEMRNVYCSFIAGSTPTWLTRAVTPAIIEGGFTSRCYFIDGAARKRSVAWPEERNDKDERERLTNRLVEISRRAERTGRIDLNNNAISAFKQWYDSRPAHRDAYRQSFESREDAHVLRLAALLAVNDGDWLVNVHHIRNAIQLVKGIKNDGQRLFTGTTVSRNDIRLVEKIRTELNAASVSGISQSALLRLMRPAYRADQIRSVLTIMHELDLVQKFTVESSGRPKTVWRGTIYLSNDDLVNQAVSNLGIG